MSKALYNTEEKSVVSNETKKGTEMKQLCWSEITIEASV
jgi:hypothetical protein